MTTQKLLTRKEVAKLAGVTEQAIYKWTRENKIKVACKVGNRPRYSDDDVQKLFKTQG